MSVHPVRAQEHPPGEFDRTQGFLPDAKFTVQRIKLTGNTVIKTDELGHILDPIAGKEATLSQLQKVADLVTAEFRTRGYSLARAYVPAQEIEDGIVEIAVLEGRVGDIIVRGNKNYSTDFIKRGFTAVIEDGILKHSSLEKSLLILNENPDLKLTAVLEPGREPGTTDIIISAEDRLPLHGIIDYNNFASEPVSRHRFGAEINLGKYLFFEGSALSLRTVLGSDPRDFRYGRASYSVPLNSYGTKLGILGYGGDFDVGKALSDLNITARSWGYGFSVSHPLAKTRMKNLIAELGFESRDSKEFLLGAVNSRDRIRALKAALNYDWLDNTGRNFISLSALQGLGEAFGAMENNDPQSSRAEADNRFTKLYLNLARVQKINEYFSIILRGSGQASTDSLVAMEQFFIGGADSVRGYPQGEFLGDDGYNVSTELRWSPLPDRKLGQLAVFFDHGGVSIKNPPAGIKKYRHLTGAGVGVRLDILDHFNARFDVGFPLQPARASSGDRPTFYLQSAVRF